VSEKEYKELGDELAKLAVSSGLSGDQLRQLYRYVRTRSTPEVEARVQRQIGRSASRSRGGPRGYNVFGPRFLELVEEYGGRKKDLERVLWYTNMVYPYHMAKAKGSAEGQPGSPPRPRQPPASGSVDRDFERRLSEVVEEACSRYGYAGLQLSQERGGYLATVSLRRFRGNPRKLSEDLYKEAMSHFPELSNRLRFWIDRRR